MGVQAEDRVRGALLAGLAVVALVVGGWWWQRSAPVTGPVPARAESTPPAGASLDQLLVTVDKDGRVLPGPEETLVLHQEPAAPAPGMVARTVWVERSQLDPTGPPLVRQTAAASGEDYQLLVGCTGPGKLTVTFSGAGDGGPGLPVACASPPVTIIVTASGGPLQVRFVAADGGVGLDAQLTALF